MKREYMEELRALVDSIRREGKSRRSLAREVRWRFIDFLRGRKSKKQALVPVRISRRIPSPSQPDWN